MVLRPRAWSLAKRPVASRPRTRGTVTTRTNRRRRRQDAALYVLTGVDPEPQAWRDGERAPTPHLPHAPPPLTQHVQPRRPRTRSRWRGAPARRLGRGPPGFRRPPARDG